MSDAADLPLVLQALAFAADKHRDQRRKDAAASPYINHPIALANVLVREGEVTDPAVLAAALLHDTVEDTQTTPAELAGRVRAARSRRSSRRSPTTSRCRRPSASACRSSTPRR